MSKATTAQLGAIGAMCTKANISKEAKQVMVAGFSNGKSTSSKDLTIEEARDMISHLATLQPEDPRVTKMQNKIFYYAHMMNWTRVNRFNKVVADGRRIDEWMEQFSYLKKKLNKYNYKELPKLISQFEMVYKHFLKSN